MSSRNERVLVLAAEPIDAEAVCATAAEAGLRAETCRTMEELCTAIVGGAGAAVIGDFAHAKAN